MIQRYGLIILGIGIVLFYLSATFGWIDWPDQVFIALVLAIAPVAILGVISVADHYAEPAENRLAIYLGKIYGIAAFILFEAVMCIQLGSRTYFKDKLIPEAASAEVKEMIQTAYKAANATQFTMDIAFDVFYCLMIVLFSIAMILDKNYGRLIGIYGVLSGTGLLLLNLWTFPYPPAESGLIDLGPATAIWWVWAIILIFIAQRKSKSTDANDLTTPSLPE